MNILQLSDIHYGGEYDGKFNCRLNFLATLDYALNYTKVPYDLIVITGDLADRDHLAHYADIKTTLDRTGIAYFVLPGNHDDVAAMRSVFGDHALPACGYRALGGIMFWDNSSRAAPTPPPGYYSTLFCHYPVGTVPHAFMEKHALPNSDALLADLAENHGVRNVFCGHFHWSDDILSSTPQVHVCPATQCQLDPACPECSPVPESVPSGTGLPGYTRIELDQDSGAMVDYRHERVFPRFPLYAMFSISDEAIVAQMDSLGRIAESMANLTTESDDSCMHMPGIAGIRDALLSIGLGCRAISKKLPAVRRAAIEAIQPRTTNEK